jgi:hypothetical protein
MPKPSGSISVHQVLVRLGVFALIAVGVHAAADAVDDRFLWAADGLDAFLDRILGAWSVTQPLVNWIGTEERTLVARSLALLWEVSADLVMALPLLRASEPTQTWRWPLEPRPWTGALRSGVRGWRWPQAREEIVEVLKRPTTLRLIRPVLSAAFALAGSAAVARMVQSSVFLGLRAAASDDVAQAFARLAAIAVLAGAFVLLGLRAVWQTWSRADQLSREKAQRPWQWLTLGLPGTALAAPLAIAAIDAASFFAFFR